MSKTRMQIGCADGWSTLHLQCGMSSKQRDLVADLQRVEVREWGVVLDLPISKLALTALRKTATQNHPSLNNPSGGDKTYVKVTSISLPDWAGVHAGTLVDDEEDAIGTLHIECEDEEFCLYLHKDITVTSLASITQIAYPELMI